MDEKDGKKVKSTSASMVDLKAELFRKQEEFRLQKLQSENSSFLKGKPSTSSKKPSLFSKKNAGVTKRAEKDYEEKVEEENVFEKSKKSLEKKARLYEQISNSRELPDEDGSGVYLVDFQRKVMDDVTERLEAGRHDAERREREAREAEEERHLQAIPVPEPDTPDEEWVDYVDAFGRSRRCLRKDLPTVQKQDSCLLDKKRQKDEQVLRGQRAFQELRDKADASDTVPSLLSQDMVRELERQKWEQQELEQMAQEKEGPIHYADVHHNEVRTHGVGFYKFDKEEETRQAQMDQLNQLRQQTKKEQTKSERIKEKRKAALAVRLAKVKKRKRERLGLPEEEEEDPAKLGNDVDIGPKLSEQTRVENEPLTRDDSWRKTTPTTREWDKGKQVSLEDSERRWLEKQRAERDKEFAPPSFYYDSQPKQSSNKNTETKDNTRKNVKKNQSKHASERHSDKQCPVDISSIIGEKLHEIRESTSCDAQNLSCEAQSHLNKMQENKSVKRDNYYKDSHASMSCTGQAVVDIPLPDTQTQPPMGYMQSFNLPPPPPPNANPPINQTVDETAIISPSVPSVSETLQQTNFSVPPPNFTIPPPTIPVHLQMFQVPPPNLSVPPPGFQPVQNIVPPQMAMTNQQSSTVNVNPVNSNLQTNVEMPHVKQTAVQSNKHQSVEQPRKKIIPKMDIIDTRLMESD